jgi:hypothetical protein
MATKYAPYIMMACVGSSLLSSFVYLYTKEEPSLGPSPGPTSTETYIAMPRMEPSFCGATTEMNYIFDPVGGSISSGGIASA